MKTLIERDAEAVELDPPSTSGGRPSTPDLAGQAFVPVSHPGEVAPVSAGELALFEQARGGTGQAGALHFGVSVDGLSSPAGPQASNNLGRPAAGAPLAEVASR